MMRTHNGLTETALELADAFDSWTSGMARMRLHAQAAFARAWHRRPPIDFVAGPATPHDVIADERLARLLHYPATAPQPKKLPPLVVVASLINRYYVMDLLPELSVFAQLNRRGFDIYVLDWKAPGALGPSLTFADYVDGVIPWAAREAAARHGGAAPSLVGYCMGGTMAAMAAARHPSAVRAVALLGTPIEFATSGALAAMTERGRFDADLMMDLFGNMPPLMMQTGFKLLNPADAWDKLVNLVRDAGDAERVRHFVALESWLDDNIAFPGGLYREYIRSLYQEDSLCKRTMKIAGTPVDLAKLTAPLLNVVALRDHICAPPAARALMALAGSRDKTLLEFDTGHIGLTTSRRSLGDLWPRIADWLEARA
jgi:polyhydroxyalkanoate synthase subunit PhaC